MKKLVLNSKNVVLLFEPNEYGLLDGISTDEELNEHTQNLLRSAGVEPAGGSMYLEMFEYDDKTILFVTLSDKRRKAVYSFRTLDDIATLARALPDTYADDSEIYTYNNEYYLILTQPYPCHLFAEYGRPRTPPEGIALHLREHGRRLIPAGAVSTLRRYC